MLADQRWKKCTWQKKLSSGQYRREILKRSWFFRKLSPGDHIFQNRSSVRVRNEKLKQTSSLFRLDSLLDQKGSLRAEGRLKKAAIAFEVNHPIIITQNESHHRASYQTLPEQRPAPPGSWNSPQCTSKSRLLDNQWSFLYCS